MEKEDAVHATMQKQREFSSYLVLSLSTSFFYRGIFVLNLMGFSYLGDEMLQLVHLRLWDLVMSVWFATAMLQSPQHTLNHEYEVVGIA